MLDGQQRLTSIFRVIFRSRLRNKTTPDPDLLVALSSGEEWVESPFHLRSKTLQRRMRDGLLVPAEVLFEGVRGGNESLAVQRALGEWLTAGDALFFEALDRANAIRNVDPAGRGGRLRDRRRRQRRQRHRDLRAPEPAGRAPAPGRSGGGAPDRADDQLPRAGARGAGDARSCAASRRPRAHEEGSRSGAFVDTDLLIRGALFLGGGGVRYREAEKTQGCRRTTRTSRPAGTRRSPGFKSAVALFRNAGVPGGDWLPYRYLLFAPAIAAARGHELGRSLDRAGRWPPACGATTAGEVDTKLAKDAALAARGDVEGLIEQVKLRAKRPESAIPDEEDLLHNIVGENAILFALLVYFMQRERAQLPERQAARAARRSRWRCTRSSRARRSTAIPDRDNEYVPDRLGNLTLLARSDKEHLGEIAPDVYLRIIEPRDRAAHLIPDDDAPLVGRALQRVLRAARARAGGDAARPALRARDLGST